MTKTSQETATPKATITEPGIYRDVGVADYHNDPCPEPSFSQSIAKLLLERSPAHAAQAHPRLASPLPEDDDAPEKYTPAKVIGDAAHALMIGRGKTLAIGDFDSWRSDKSKAFRAEAEAAGQLPILAKHMAAAERIVIAAHKQLDAHEERGCFLHGSGEVALIWREGDLWFRCLVDWLHDDLRAVEDFKTTGMSVAEHVIGLRAADAGWDIQAAMIERGLDALDPDNAGRRRIRFVAQEQDAPFALNVMVMTEHWLTMGRKRLQFALDIWARCMRSGRWPSYPPRAVFPEYPGFKETQWLNRELQFEEYERVVERAAFPADGLMGG